MVLGFACLPWVSDPANAEPSGCNQPASRAITQIDVPGRPFSAVPSADGCSIFVSLTGRNGRSQVAVLARSNGEMSLLRTVAAPGQLTGMALSGDGKVLVAATGQGIVLLSTERLVTGAENALLDGPAGGAGAGHIYVAFTPDDKRVFVSAERSDTLSVYDFTEGSTGSVMHLAGQIRTGGAPVGLVLSPDGRWLYSTSEVGPGERSCAPEGKGPVHPAGMLMVIDVARSAVDPASAVVARVPAGCNPVRVAVSPTGDRVYVTARGSHAVIVFDASKLVSDPDHSQQASVPVGPSPVGIAVDGAHVFVANSDRFGAGRNASISFLDVNHLDVAAGRIPAGGFPRELKLTRDGRSLLVTNFGSGSVELIDLERLAELRGITMK